MVQSFALDSLSFWASLVAQLVKNLPAIQETLVWPLGREDPPGERIGYPLHYHWASPVAQMVKNLPAVWETWVWCLGWEYPLEESLATHSSILAWRIPPRTEEPGGLQSMGSQRVRHNGVAKHSTAQSKLLTMHSQGKSWLWNIPEGEVICKVLLRKDIYGN